MFAVDGRTAAPAGDVSKEMTAVVNASPGAVITLAVQYRSRLVDFDGGRQREVSLTLLGSVKW